MARLKIEWGLTRQEGVEDYPMEVGRAGSADIEARRGGALVRGNDKGSPGIPRGPCAGPSNPPTVLRAT